MIRRSRECLPQVLSITIHDVNQEFLLVISFKSASSIFEERLCAKSENIRDFKKCVREIIRKPFINKIYFNSYEQSYELTNVGVADFIYPAKYSITVDLSPAFSLNKVIWW